MEIPIDLFDNYLRSKDLKDRTIKNYFYYLDKFILNGVFNQESVSRFLSLKGNRNSVAKGFITNLQKFLIINRTELNISESYYNQITDVQVPKLTGRKKQRLINPLSPEQIRALEISLETEELKLMMILTYYCGLRLGELMKIRINSFNWETWKKDITQMGEIKVFGKGDKEGIAIVPAFLMIRLSKYIHSIKDKKGIDSPLFDHKERSFQGYLNYAGVKAGITKKDSKGLVLRETAVHPHKLRHSYAHNLLMQGVDIRYIKEALRHSSIQSTQIYTQLNKQELKDKINSSMFQ